MKQLMKIKLWASLKTEIEKIIKEQKDKKIFDIEEIKLCKESNYYKYIDFGKIM